MYLEIALVLLLTVINGVLAMSELAIVSARTARLKVMAESGDRGAATAIRLADDPGRFLSSVQIGITLVGVLSGAFSGATLGARLSDTLLAAGMPASLAEPLGVGSVVIAITYLSLIIGELVPKQIALRAPESVAARVAPMVRTISWVAAPLVWLLDRSGKLALTLLGQSGETDQNMSDEEVRLVISEAQNAGVLEHAETQMIAGVMRIADRNARGLMTPRHEVEMIDVGDSFASIVKLFRDTRRSRLPVRDGGPDDIIGVVTTRDFLTPGSARAKFDLRAVILPAPVVRDATGALGVIDTLRTAPAHVVLVYDEYGHFQGIITPMDVLEAITGDFRDEIGDEEKIVQRDDESLIVAGWMPADEFAERTGLTLDADRSYQTVAGLVLDRMARLPAVGEKIVLGN